MYGWQDDDLISNDEKDAKKNVRYMFEYHKPVAPRSLDIAIKRFLGYFFDFFGNKLSEQLWDGIVGNSISGLFDTFLEKSPDYVNEKFKPSESWFYGWEPYRLMRYNDDIAVYIGNVNTVKADCECWQKSLWYDSYATFDRFLYGISNLCKGTWISYALMLYYLGGKLFGSKEEFLDALGKVETSKFDSKEDFFKAFDEGTGMFASKK